METVTIKAYAKINLTLDVIGKRPDGYHQVQMIMQQIDLYDSVTLTRREAGITLGSDCEFIPMDSQNLAWRAAELIREAAGLSGGVHITVQKRIPVAAGLAGGSSDAAAVIEGMDRLYGLGLSLQEKMALGLRLGADVPFCLMGGTALAEGIGEQLTRVPGLRDTWLVVCKPNFGVSTKEVYGHLQWERIQCHPDTQGMLEALADCSLKQVSALLGNVLEEVTLARYPEVRSIKEKMLQYGAEGALMSGSGPTVFGVFRTQEKAKSACANLKRYYRQSFAVKTITDLGEPR